MRLSSKNFAEDFYFSMVVFDMISGKRGRVAGMLMGTRENSYIESFNTVTENQLKVAIDYRTKCDRNRRLGVEMPREPCAEQVGAALKMVEKAFSSMKYMFKTDEERLSRRVNVWAYWAVFGQPSFFITINPYDLGSATLSNFISPEEMTNYLKKQNLPSKKHRMNMIGKNPVEVAVWFRRIIFQVLQIIIGIDPKTKLCSKKDGLFGHAFAYSGCIDEQERLSLHLHLLLWILEFPGDKVEVQEKIKENQRYFKQWFQKSLSSLINAAHILPIDNLACPECEQVPLTQCENIIEDNAVDKIYTTLKED